MPKLMHPQTTDSIIMAEPIDFGFNEQTSADNHFQNKLSLSQSEITKRAQNEFEKVVAQLTQAGVTVTILPKLSSTRTPDAVFPNNWFSTRNDGSLIIYPMKTANRCAEVHPQKLNDKLAASGYEVRSSIDLRQRLQPDMVLEGTGSLIFHHPTRQIFAAISERCQAAALSAFQSLFDYQITAFSTQTQSGHSVYHTNVLMSCGEKFALLCDDVIIKSKEKNALIGTLETTVSDLIFISEQQMAESFCGNILQIHNRQKVPYIVMSESAYQSFTPKQKALLEKHGELLICSIPVIEKIGGGSIRCMLAENFLPRKIDSDEA